MQGRRSQSTFHGGLSVMKYHVHTPCHVVPHTSVDVAVALVASPARPRCLSTGRPPWRAAAPWHNTSGGRPSSFATADLVSSRQVDNSVRGLLCVGVNCRVARLVCAPTLLPNTRVSRSERLRQPARQPRRDRGVAERARQGGSSSGVPECPYLGRS